MPKTKGKGKKAPSKKKDGSSTEQKDTQLEKKKQEEMAAAMEANLSLIQIVWNHLVSQNCSPEQKFLERRYIDNCTKNGVRATTKRTVDLDRFKEEFLKLVCIFQKFPSSFQRFHIPILLTDK